MLHRISLPIMLGSGLYYAYHILCRAAVLINYMVNVRSGNPFNQTLYT